MNVAVIFECIHLRAILCSNDQLTSIFWLIDNTLHIILRPSALEMCFFFRKKASTYACPLQLCELNFYRILMECRCNETQTVECLFYHDVWASVPLVKILTLKDCTGTLIDRPINTTARHPTSAQPRCLCLSYAFVIRVEVCSTNLFIYHQFTLVFTFSFSFESVSHRKSTYSLNVLTIFCKRTRVSKHFCAHAHEYILVGMPRARACVCVSVFGVQCVWDWPRYIKYIERKYKKPWLIILYLI